MKTEKDIRDKIKVISENILQLQHKKDALIFVLDENSTHLG